MDKAIAAQVDFYCEAHGVDRSDRQAIHGGEIYGGEGADGSKVVVFVRLREIGALPLDRALNYLRTGER